MTSMKQDQESCADSVCTVLSSQKLSATLISFNRLLRLNTHSYSLVRVPMSRSTMPFSWPTIFLAEITSFISPLIRRQRSTSSEFTD